MGFWSNIFGGDDLQSEGDRLDAELKALNQREYAPGGRLYSTDYNYQIVLDHLESGATGNVHDQIDTAFDEGWEEGKANVTGTVGRVFGTAGDIFSSVLKGVPWWVWALVAVYLLWPVIGAKLVKQ